MKLVRVAFEQFRRFGEPQELNTDERLVALVGPNEAGKSSILDAIEMLLNRQPPTARDVTRAHPGPAVIRGTFLLDGDDQQAIGGIHDCQSTTRCTVEVRSDSPEEVWTFDPRPHRDLNPRKRCVDLLTGIADDPALNAAYSQNLELPWDPSMFADVRAQLATETETLDEGVITSFETLAERLRDLHPPGVSEEEAETLPVDADTDERSVARWSAASALNELASHERGPLPSVQACDVLRGRMPGVAFFRPIDRELSSAYNLDEVVSQKPPALENLMTIAGLNLDHLQALVGNDNGEVVRLFEQANAHLKNRFQERYSQSNVYPLLPPPLDGVLHLFIATENEGFSEPAQRSEGLMWFLALDAFLEARAHLVGNPILLVDEAETHLHYDAQADLIDALMRQRVASKVIYSTHSVGCLPPDLGRGIRAAKPEQELSIIKNSYWSIRPPGDDKLGYTPLLFAMGAQLLSLTVPRYGIITEGPSDAILLPTLFREAAGVETLRYRIMPGLAELRLDRFIALGEHGGKVACLTDGDTAGLGMQQQIHAANVIEPDCVLGLDDVGADLTLEDLVIASVFAQAFNNELEALNITAVRADPATLPATGRWNFLKAEAANVNEDLSIVSKNRVAQNIVDMRFPEDVTQPVRPILEPTLMAGMKALHDKLCVALDA